MYLNGFPKSKISLKRASMREGSKIRETSLWGIRMRRICKDKLKIDSFYIISYKYQISTSCVHVWRIWLTDEMIPETLPLNIKILIISYLIIDWIVDFFSVRSGMAPRVSYTSSNRTRRRRSCELQFDVFCNPPAMKSRTCWRLWSLSITEIHAIDYS